jgi:hypothetical protein
MSDREESCSYHWLDEVTGQGHQARQQVQRYKRLLLTMPGPPLQTVMYLERVHDDRGSDDKGHVVC